MASRGYVFRERLGRSWVIPTFDPSWIQAGNNTYAQVLMMDFDKAFRVVKEGFSFDEPRCLLDPPLDEWDQFVRDFLKDPSRPLAADIETPYKRDQDEDELENEDDPLDHDVTYQIDRISFAYASGFGASVEWSARYMDGIRALITGAAYVSES